MDNEPAQAGVPRASCRYQSQARDQTARRLRLRDLAGARVRYGYRRLHILPALARQQVNHKRVFRLYRQEGLSLRLKSRKKRVSLPRVPPPAAERPNQRWSMDFVAERLADGRRFRILTLVDDMSRVSPSSTIGSGPTARWAIAPRPNSWAPGSHWRRPATNPPGGPLPGAGHLHEGLLS